MERGLIGHCRSMFANRPSYALNVVGPSFTFLGTEITGFEAVNHAWQEIRMGRCKAAFVMASNMVFKPELSRHFQELGFLTQDAKRVYASIIHSSLECHGQYSGKLAPSAESLEHVMKKCYDSTGIHPEDIDYLEVEGVGVKEKDEEEMKAVDNVILSKRKTPLLIGSVKSNMGHSYGASSLCSMVKVLIAMQKGVVTEPTPCDISIAAVNGFSCIVEYSAHLLLRAHDRHKPSNTHIDGLPRLVLLSSRTEDGLTKLMKSIEDMPVDVEFIRLLHDIHSLNIPRHLQRGYTIVPPLETPVNEVQYYDHVIKRPVWFIFSGMGSQWNTMGKELMKFPVCAAAIERCHEILAEEGVDLKYIITTEDPTVFDNILNCFVGIASIQIALVDLLKTIGIAPDGMVGHSVGELGCAYADGCLTLKEMILSSYYRGRASLEAETIVGSMAAIGLGYNTMKTMIPPEIDIACHNGADSCTLSGPSDLVKEYVRKLQKRNIFAKAVNVANIAYHSRYIAPAAPVLLNYLKKLLPNPKARSSRWISSSVPEEKWNEPLAQCCSAEYLTNNLLSSVLFEEACKYVPKDAITIEIAPHGLLQAILRPGLSPQVKELYPPVQLPVSRGTPSISPLIQWDHSEDYFALAENENLILTSGQQEILVSLKQGTFQDYTHNVIDGNVVFPVSAYLIYS
ncbi:Fatty acid synthase [Blattella germanica]|nr:Fatty acid synthase [Blattella germanica]